MIPLNPKIRAVIFDMDGVLVHSEPLIAAAAIAMFREQGLLVQPQDFVPFVGTGEDRYIGGVAETYGFTLDLPAAKQRTYELYLDLVPLHLKAFSGAYDLVLVCRQAGLCVAIASSADTMKVVANLQSIGLPPAFWDVVVTGEQVRHKKPAPDIFLSAAQNLGADPAACVVIEDAVHGIHAAKAAGMRCIALAHTLPAECLLEADSVRDRISQVRLSDITPDLALQSSAGMVP